MPHLMIAGNVVDDHNHDDDNVDDDNDEDDVDDDNDEDNQDDESDDKDDDDNDDDGNQEVQGQVPWLQLNLQSSLQLSSTESHFLKTSNLMIRILRKNLSKSLPKYFNPLVRSMNICMLLF